MHRTKDKYLQEGHTKTETETISSILGRGEDKKKQKGYKYTKEVKEREAHTEVKEDRGGDGNIKSGAKKEGH